MMKSNMHILVVDDNRGVLAALDLLLRRHFGQVTLLANPSATTATRDSTGSDGYWPSVRSFRSF